MTWVRWAGAPGEQSTQGGLVHVPGICAPCTHTRSETELMWVIKEEQKPSKPGRGRGGSRSRPYQEPLHKFRAEMEIEREGQKGTGTGEARDLLPGATWAVDGLLT